MKRLQPFLGTIALTGLLGFLPGCRTAAEPESCEPVPVSNPGVSKAYYQVGDFRLAGQPNEEGLDGFRKEGIETVINLRPESELKGFDEKGAVESRGMDYVSFPVTSQTLSDQTVEEFLETVKSVKKPAVIHCGSANRVSGLWATYLVKEKGVEPEEALRLAEKSGLRDGPVKEFVEKYLREQASEASTDSEEE